MPWVFVFSDVFFSFFCLLHILLTNPELYHLYRATARHSGASSTKVTCEWKTSALCCVLLGTGSCSIPRVFSGYRVLPKRLFLVFLVIFHSDCAEELPASLLLWVYLFLFFFIYDIISVHVWWHGSVLLVGFFSALDFFFVFLLQLLIETLQMCF